MICDNLFNLNNFLSYTWFL